MPAACTPVLAFSESIFGVEISIDTTVGSGSDSVLEGVGLHDADPAVFLVVASGMCVTIALVGNTCNGG